MEIIFIVRMVLSTFLYATISGILANNEITQKTKSYWGVMIASATLYIIGWLFGRIELLL